MRRAVTAVGLASVIFLFSGALMAQAPSVLTNGVVNAASFTPATAAGGAVPPGALVSIFGSNLAGAVQQSLSVPLSTKLGDTSVTFTVGSSTFAAPLVFVAPNQINAQLPVELPLGGAVSVTVKRDSTGTSAPKAVAVEGAQPGIFTQNQQGTGPGDILDAVTNVLNDSGHPGHPNGFLAIYCTGLGPLKTPVPSGQAATGADETVNPVLVDIANIPAKVLYGGAAPFFVGLYQVNVQIPAGTPAGEQNLVITVNGVKSNTATVFIAAP